MKKAKTTRAEDLRPEYKRSDFGKMVRGKYARRFKKATNIVMLEPEIAKAYPNEKAVNEALRSLLVLVKTSTRVTERVGGRGKRRRAA